jgi:hypothetical protein
LQEPYKKINDNLWVVTVQEHNETKELYLQFPPGAIDQVGWDEGDTIVWGDNQDGTWTLTKKESDET